jgi:hypothetical protein
MAKIRQARKCRAHRKDGQPCRNYAIVGGVVCVKHGGAAGQVRRKARERRLEADIYRTLAAWSSSPAAREASDRAALASDRLALEAFARRLG